MHKYLIDYLLNPPMKYLYCPPLTVRSVFALPCSSSIALWRGFVVMSKLLLLLIRWPVSCAVFSCTYLALCMHVYVAHLDLIPIYSYEPAGNGIWGGKHCNHRCNKKINLSKRFIVLVCVPRDIMFFCLGSIPLSGGVSA